MAGKILHPGKPRRQSLQLLPPVRQGKQVPADHQHKAVQRRGQKQPPAASAAAGKPRFPVCRRPLQAAHGFGNLLGIVTLYRQPGGLIAEGHRPVRLRGALLDARLSPLGAFDPDGPPIDAQILQLADQLMVAAPLPDLFHQPRCQPAQKRRQNQPHSAASFKSASAWA